MSDKQQSLLCQCGHDRRGLANEVVCPECGEPPADGAVSLRQALKVIPMGRLKVGYLLGLLNIFLVFVWVMVFSNMMMDSGGFGMNFAPVTMAFVYFMMLGLDAVGLSLCFSSNRGFEQVLAKHGRRYAICAMVIPVPAFFLILAMA
tara:strand:- start:215 stop:655 length:441 start_codon:yes stop_codon:yes gene_type:complete